MHPAKSVILFTTASGAGYGLLAWLGCLAVVGLLPAGTAFILVSFGLALGLVTVGLLSSTFHLGHPERAWRALSQWRSSWLSREGVAALVAYAPAGLLAIAALAGAGWPLLALLGLLTIAAAAATVACTAMIYASLRAVPAWHDRLTLPGYLLFAAMTGAVLAHALLALWGEETAFALGLIGSILCGAGAALKRRQWHRIDTRKADSTPETATGLGGLGKVRLLEGPHTSPNYLMREMGFAVARKHAARLRTMALWLAFLTPALVLVLAILVPWPALNLLLALIAVVAAAIGIAVERWLFFAEAQHVVTLYYGGRIEPQPA